MRCPRLVLHLAVCGLGLLQAAVAAPQANAYDLRSLAAPDTLSQMQRCLGTAADVDAMRRFHAQTMDSDDRSQALQLQAGSASAVVLAAAGQWTCVAMSHQGFPRWPVEALHGLIVPVGVPSEVTLRWRQELLEQVALDGVGRGLIVYPSGDADLVHVIAERGEALRVKFTTRLMHAGEYRESQFQAVLHHPALTRLVTRSAAKDQGTPSRMAIPPHRLLRPVRDDFVLVEPTAPTRSFDFATTRWTFLTVGGQLALLPAGQVMHATGSTSTPGTWRVSDGVLQVSMDDGTRYALTLMPDGLSLAGIGRRAEAQAQEEEGSEWQWPIRLRKHGVPPAAPSDKARDA